MNTTVDVTHNQPNTTKNVRHHSHDSEPRYPEQRSAEPSVLHPTSPVTEHQWLEHIENFIGKKKQPAPFVWAGKAVRAVNVISTRAAGKMAFNIWFTPQNRPINETDHAWLSSASQETMDYQGNAIPIYQWGSGPTILTVHGWGGHSGQFRQLTQALVNAGYRVMAFDAPGHGRAEGKTTNAEEISEIIQQIAQQETLTGIISHSIGGLSSHNALNAGAEAGFHVVLNTPMCLSHIVHTFKHQLSLPSEVIDQHKALMEQKFGDNFWGDYDLRNQSYHMPQFYSYDDKDHQVSLEVGKTLKSQIPTAEHRFTQALGHNKAVRDPEVIDAVKAFIERNAE
ncbi:alpha/beta hydrolase [Litoribrevibacter euphylliae]|uniref:Alpha/beta hydrolase n=1 Tax=Litoribrevibacter euphylliae TaxID=1834034 RepID=A0ABV7HED8_9GAMM